MHSTFTALLTELKLVITQLQSTIPSDEPFSVANNDWSLPGLTRGDLIEEAQSLVEVIEQHEADELQEGRADALLDYVRRLQHLHIHNIPNLWRNPNLAVPSFMLTLQGLRSAIVKALPVDNHVRSSTKLRRLIAQVRNMEARLLDLEPRTVSLVSMVSRIEDAHNAADQLPTDLASLAESRTTLDILLRDSTIDFGKIQELRTQADDLDARLLSSAEEAKAVLERCQTAYSAATSVGLAAAFSERSTTLSRSMWFWVVGLVVALGAGSHFGSSQLQSLSSLFQQQKVETEVIVLNLLRSVLSVAAPVWFGWLATKQIGQRFRLSEDYAFKASISRAYEGFRREAARVDKDMEAQLLASALSRLDEQPLRLVESENHGSPWHELASSDIVKQAMRVVPGFSAQVKESAASAINAVKRNRSYAEKAEANQEAS